MDTEKDSDMPQAQKRTVLLVEDDEFLRSLIVRRLVAAGYAVVVAKSGEEALARVAESPELILLDLVLPGMGGFELIAKLRQSEETKGIPFIVMSNSAEEENRRRAQELQASGYLVKAQSSPVAIAAAVDAFFSSRH